VHNNFSNNKKNKFIYFFLVFLFFFICSYNNSIEAGLFFASGDNYQIVDLSNYLSKKFGIWEFFESGRINNNFFSDFLYHSIFIIFSKFYIDNSYTSSVLMFLYLFFSFLSFYYSLTILNINLDFIIKIFLSISYSINFFIFYIFWYTWGYTFTISAYIFVPILISIFYKYNKETSSLKKIKIIIIYLPIFFISNVAYGNIAWLIIFNLINLFIFLITNFNTVKKKEIKNFLKNLTFFLIFNFIFFLFTLPSIVINFFSIKESFLPNIENLDSLFNWIYSQNQMLPSAYYFIRHYSSMNTLNNFQLLTIINYIILFYLLLKNKKWDEKSYIFFLLLFIIIFFTFKGIGILPSGIVNFIFGETLFYSFRSEDKSSILLPFICLIIISINLTVLDKGKITISLIIIIINLLSSYPIITGKIHKDHGINIDKIIKSKFKTIKKIDEDIVAFREITNKDSDNFLYNILEAPYTLTVSRGWSDFTNSSHRGISYFEQFSKMQLININKNQNLLSKNLLEFWSKKENLESWDMTILKLLSIKYILEHKYVPEMNYDTKKKFIILEKQNIIKKIYNGKNINIYEINKNYLNPKIYIPDKIIFGPLKNNNSLEKLVKNNKFNYSFVNEETDQSKNYNTNYILEKITNTKVNYRYFKNKIDTTTINFEETKINKFYINQPNKEFYLAFTQSYDDYWKLKCLNCPKNIIIEKVKINGNFNGWKIILKEKINSLEFEIDYQLNKYVNIYFIFLLVVYLLLLWIKKKLLSY
jgi:hypothetical protein